MIFASRVLLLAVAVQAVLAIPSPSQRRGSFDSDSSAHSRVDAIFEQDGIEYDLPSYYSTEYDNERRRVSTSSQASDEGYENRIKNDFKQYLDIMYARVLRASNVAGAGVVKPDPSRYIPVKLKSKAPVVLESFGRIEQIEDSRLQSPELKSAIKGFHNDNLLSLSWVGEVVKNINPLFSGMKEYFVHQVAKGMSTDFMDGFHDSLDRHLTTKHGRFADYVLTTMDNSTEAFTEYIGSVIQHLFVYLIDRSKFELVERLEADFFATDKAIASGIFNMDPKSVDTQAIQDYHKEVKNLRTVPLSYIFNLNDPEGDLPLTYTRQEVPVIDTEVVKNFVTFKEKNEGDRSPVPSNHDDDNESIISNDYSYDGSFHDVLSESDDGRTALHWERTSELESVLSYDLISIPSRCQSPYWDTTDILSEDVSEISGDENEESRSPRLSDWGLFSFTMARPKAHNKATKSEGAIAQNVTSLKELILNLEKSSRRETTYGVYNFKPAFAAGTTGQNLPLLRSNGMKTMRHATHSAQVSAMMFGTGHILSTMIPLRNLLHEDTCTVIKQLIDGSASIYFDVVKKSVLESIQEVEDNFERIVEGMLNNLFALDEDNVSVHNSASGGETDKESLHHDTESLTLSESTLKGPNSRRASLNDASLLANPIANKGATNAKSARIPSSVKFRQATKMSEAAIQFYDSSDEEFLNDEPDYPEALEATSLEENQTVKKSSKRSKSLRARLFGRGVNFVEEPELIGVSDGNQAAESGSEVVNRMAFELADVLSDGSDDEAEDENEQYDGDESDDEGHYSDVPKSPKEVKNYFADSLRYVSEGIKSKLNTGVDLIFRNYEKCPYSSMPDGDKKARALFKTLIRESMAARLATVKGIFFQKTPIFAERIINDLVKIYIRQSWTIINAEGFYCYNEENVAPIEHIVD